MLANLAGQLLLIQERKTNIFSGTHPKKTVSHNLLSIKQLTLANTAVQLVLLIKKGVNNFSIEDLEPIGDHRRFSRGMPSCQSKWLLQLLGDRNANNFFEADLETNTYTSTSTFSQDIKNEYTKSWFLNGGNRTSPCMSTSTCISNSRRRLYRRGALLQPPGECWKLWPRCRLDILPDCHHLGKMRRRRFETREKGRRKRSPTWTTDWLPTLRRLHLHF